MFKSFFQCIATICSLEEHKNLYYGMFKEKFSVVLKKEFADQMKDIFPGTIFDNEIK